MRHARFHPCMACPILQMRPQRRHGPRERRDIRLHFGPSAGLRAQRRNDPRGASSRTLTPWCPTVNGKGKRRALSPRPSPLATLLLGRQIQVSSGEFSIDPRRWCNFLEFL